MNLGCATLIQEIDSHNSIVAKSYSTASTRRLFQQYRPEAVIHGRLPITALDRSVAPRFRLRLISMPSIDHCAPWRVERVFEGLSPKRFRYSTAKRPRWENP